MLSDKKIAVILIVIATLILVTTYRYPPETVAFPRFFVYVLYVLSILLFILPQKMSSYNVNLIFSKEKFISMGFLIVYVILFPKLGFFITTFLFQALYMSYFYKKGWKKHLIIAVSYGLLFYVVFQKWLYIWFPKGLLM